MKNIEDVIVDKIYDLVNKALAKKIHPDMTYQTVTSINDEEIEKIKSLGIEGIILDIDETMRKDMKDIPECNRQWLEKIKEEFKVIVVSNGVDRKVENFLKEKGIDYIGFAHKPLKKNFIKACDSIGVKPEKVLVIGDTLIDDIYGGKKNNMKTALIKDVDER